MGEKGGGKGDDGEKKKAEGGEKKKEEGGGGEKKKDDGPITVVLKVDMHCEGCAKKVKRSVSGFQGVESVSADLPNSKLTVVGKVDPWEIRDRVESKTHKKVVLVSPANAPKKAAAAAAGKKEGGDGAKKPDDKKPKEAVSTTVVLKIRLHCEGCTQRIRRVIYRVKGVEKVSIDSQKEQVTVKGTMDVKALPDYLKEKLKRSVEIVPPPKKDDAAGGGEKKEEKKEKGGGGEKEKGGEKKKEEGGGGGEKKKEEGGEKKEEAKVVAEANKMDYYGYPTSQQGAYTPYGGYRIEMVHAPQIFSDENPNACSIM